jgi:hypothetical protein
MTEKQRHRQEFVKALRDELAQLWREGEDRVERVRVEEVGQRFDLDEDDARKTFVASRGDVWEGEFVETDEEPGWEAVVLENVPTAARPDSSIP